MTEERTYSNVKRQRIVGTPVADSQSERQTMTAEGMTVEQLMAASVLDLKKVCPFFFAALYVVPRIESKEIGAISVSPDKLYYNSGFLATVPRPQLSFYLIHGLYHIMMKHHLRGIGLDPMLWNKACNLYINRCIAEEFGVRPGDEPVLLVGPSGQSAQLQMPREEEYDEDIDVQNDTPERIYLRLSEPQREEEPKNDDGESNSGEKGHDGRDGEQGKEGSGQEGSSGDDAQKGEDNNEREEEPQSEPEQQDSPQEQPQEDADQTRDNEHNDEKDGQSADSGSEQNDGTAQSDAEQEQPQQQNSALDDDSGRQQTQTTSSAQTETNGNDDRQRLDLIDDADSANASRTSMGQKANRLLQKIETTYSQVMQGTYGRGTAYDKVAQALVQDELVPRIDWRVLLQNRLVAMQLDEKALSHPDRRFVHRGLYLEGPVVEEELLTDIKICVDTSASMSDEDVAVALRQISQLLRQYKVKAELVFWDEEVEAIAPFANQHELNLARKQAMGRGGTNPNCLFELFSRKSGQGCVQKKTKLLLIFTDGYFEWPKPEYRRAFDRDTIWILSAQESVPLEKFTPGFGRVARMKTEGWKKHGN